MALRLLVKLQRFKRAGTLRSYPKKILKRIEGLEEEVVNMVEMDELMERLQAAKISGPVTYTTPYALKRN